MTVTIETSNEVDVAYDYDTAFGTPDTGTYGLTTNTVFGLQTKLTLNAKRNLGKYYDFGTRIMAAAAKKKLEYAMDIDFVLCNEKWLDMIFCDGDGTVPTPFIFHATGLPKTISVFVNNRGEAKKRYLTTFIPNDLTLSGSIGDEMKVKISGVLQTITAGASSTVTRAQMSIAGIAAPFTFAHGTITFAAGSNYFGQLQKFDLKVGQDLGTYWDFGGYELVAAKHKKVIGGISFTYKRTANATKQLLDAVRPTSTDAENKTVVITISDGTRSFAITVTGVYLEDTSLSMDVAEDQEITGTFIFFDASVVLAGW